MNLMMICQLLRSHSVVIDAEEFEVEWQKAVAAWRA
jgi:hypothetical protein